jgi:hypothetical protein
MYIGRCYEKATEPNRRNTFPNPNAPIDALAWSSDNNSLYLCQCSLTGIKDKIDEVALIANELDKVILKDYTVRPKIYSLIITNIERTLILDEHIKEAAKKHVNIITVDKLLFLFDSVRYDNIITEEFLMILLLQPKQDQIHKASSHTS